MLFDPPVSLLCIYLKDVSGHVQNDACMGLFTTASFMIARSRKSPEGPGDRELAHHMGYFHIENYYAAVKGARILYFTNIQLCKIKKKGMECRLFFIKKGGNVIYFCIFLTYMKPCWRDIQELESWRNRGKSGYWVDVNFKRREILHCIFTHTRKF